MTVATVLTALLLSGLSLVLHTTDAVSFVPVGCYRDSVLAKARTLPELVRNYRWPKGQKEFDWNNLNKTIEACAREVNKKGYLYFGIQFYGECWSGPEGHLTFDRVKTSKHCIKGVGKSWTNFVYRLAGQENECVKYKVLDSADRAKTFKTPEDQEDEQCDNNVFGFKDGWYRFRGDAGITMPDECVERKHCGTDQTGWLNGDHPRVEDGIQTRTVCFNGQNQCCRKRQDIKVRDCGRFYVYKLPGTPGCNQRYCGNGTEPDMRGPRNLLMTYLKPK